MTYAALAGTQGEARSLFWWLLLPVLALLGVLTLLQYRQQLDDAERDLLRQADERAQELEAIARPAMAHIQDLRRLLELNWHAPPDSGPELRNSLRAWPQKRGAAIDGWTLDGAPDAIRQRHGQIWWAPASGEAPGEPWLSRAALFQRTARTVHERSPGFEGSFFVAGESNISWGYPWMETPRMLESMGVQTLQALDALRIKAAEKAVRKVEVEGQREVTYWGSPYASQLNGQWVQSHGAAVVVDGRFAGEVSLDFRLDELQRTVEAWRFADSRVWITDRDLRILADSRMPHAPPQLQGRTDQVLDVRLGSRLAWHPGDERLIPRPQDKGARSFWGGGGVLVVASRPGSPWLFAQSVPLETLHASVLPTLLPNAAVALALLATFFAGQWLFARRFVTPALGVLAYLRRLSTDPTEPEPALGRRWKGWVGAVTETFALQRALQQRERAAEAFKSALVDRAPIAIVSTSADGRLADFNPAAEAMFGITREQALQVRLDDLMRTEDGQALQEPGLAAAPTHLTGLHRSGREFPLQLVGFRVPIDGQPFEAAFITDLSAQHEAQRQLQRQRDAMRQGEKLGMMGSLLAGVAHELNNPLAIVMGRASLLEDRVQAASDAHSETGRAVLDDSRRIREAADRCGRIVRTFLNMARQRPQERRPVRLEDVARGAVDMLAYNLRGQGIRVDLRLAPDTPQVRADADQLAQVVINLLVNAQQALQDVDGPRVLTLSSGSGSGQDNTAAGALSGPHVWLRIADTGPGLPAEAREHLFEPFFTTKAAGHGTGLGLSVSRGIVRDHGGELTLEATAQGACFCIGLPVSGEPAPAVAHAPPPPSAPAPECRVLVVDDEPEIADIMRCALEGAGYDVATAESGAVALELLREARFDAVISDMRMPEMDGLALWHRVRERHPNLARRVLFVSGDTLSDQARRSLQETGCPSLDKPFSPDDLLVALGGLLQQHGPGVA